MFVIKKERELKNEIECFKQKKIAFPEMSFSCFGLRNNGNTLLLLSFLTLYLTLTQLILGV